MSRPIGPILIVDPSPGSRREIEALCERAGYAAFATGDPDEAAEWRRRHRPDLVLIGLGQAGPATSWAWIEPFLAIDDGASVIAVASSQHHALPRLS